MYVSSTGCQPANSSDWLSFPGEKFMYRVARVGYNFMNHVSNVRTYYPSGYVWMPYTRKEQVRVEDYFAFSGTDRINSEIFIGAARVHSGYCGSCEEYTDGNWNNACPVSIAPHYAIFPRNSSTLSLWWSFQNDTNDHYSHFKQDIYDGWNYQCVSIRMQSSQASTRFSYWSGSQRGTSASITNVKVAGDNALGWDVDSCGSGRYTIYVTPCEAAGAGCSGTALRDGCSALLSCADS